ncbi:hypothetical protein E0504_04740 [Parafrankia sp. BMG5.11]|nr:hypothetical protein E0504_04740 [Parafrankia sp. BMG5.11]
MPTGAARRLGDERIRPRKLHSADVVRAWSAWRRRHRHQARRRHYQRRGHAQVPLQLGASRWADPAGSGA